MTLELQNGPLGYLGLGTNLGDRAAPLAEALRHPQRYPQLHVLKVSSVHETDPSGPSEPCHLQYHRLNKQRGRMGGQVRIRVRYKKCATPWFDYLLVSREELQKIVADTGWEREEFIGASGARYIAVIRKSPNTE